MSSAVIADWSVNRSAVGVSRVGGGFLGEPSPESVQGCTVAGMRNTLTFAQQIAKAIAAAVVAFGGALVTAASDGGVVANEWWVILGSTVVAGGSVWVIPNKPPE